MSVRGVLDTSALVLLESLEGLPPDWVWSVSSLSYGELAWGVRRARGEKRARRERTVGLLRATFGPGLPFDDACAGHFGYVCHLTEQAGRRPRGRATDLFIAAVAMRHGAVLATATVEDVSHLVDALPILEIDPSGHVGELRGSG